MAYSDSITSGRAKAEAHALLDPKKANRAGMQIRECFDSDDHPATTPIVVSFDLTGSNKDVAELSQIKLCTLFGMLQRRGICQDPVVAVVGYGDAYNDIVPLQYSQFESDNAIDTALDHMYLEGGGGGNGGETATLAWYFTNNYVVTDAFEKRGKKGYYIMIADERALNLKPHHIENFIGTAEVARENLTAEYLASKLKEKWNVFVLQVDNSSARVQNAREQYEELFGKEHVLPLTNPEDMIETICAVIGAVEETLDEGDVKHILIESGASASSADTALAAVSGLFKTEGKGGAVAVIAPDLALN
jgi:hypothetical protein